MKGSRDITALHHSDCMNRVEGSSILYDGGHVQISWRPLRRYCGLEANLAVGDVENVELESIQLSAAEILASSPIPCIQSAQLRVNLFDASIDNGSVCSAATNFSSTK